MGLFRKKTDDPDQLDVLRSEITSLRERLDAADQQKTELLARVDSVDETSAALYQRVDSLDSNANELATRVGSVNDEVGRVREGVAVVNQQVDSVSSLGAEVQSLAHRLDATTAPLPPLPAPDGHFERLLRQVATLSDTVAAQGEANIVDPADINALAVRLDAISADLAAQAGRLDEVAAQAIDAPLVPTVDPDDVSAMRAEMAQMAERMATLDRRMTNVSTELANQLTELSNDLEVLLEASNDDDPDDGDDVAAVSLAIEAVQRSTERLAGEQARYQIQFREDLAELAERLRRPTSR